MVDLNSDVKKYVDPEGELVVSYASRLIISLPVSGSNTVFASNFFEVLAEIRLVLKRSGKLLTIQPNTKYVEQEDCDFIDHHLPLTEYSLGETLVSIAYRVAECILQFLPFLVDSNPSRSAKLLELHLKMPPFWRLFGKQTFMVGVKA